MQVAAHCLKGHSIPHSCALHVFGETVHTKSSALHRFFRHYLTFERITFAPEERAHSSVG